MTNSPPVWLLDVDGVINVPRPGWSAAPQRARLWSPEDNYEYTLRWAPTLVDRIRHLHKTGLVEVRWCTTWCSEASALERLWQFPPLDRAFTEPLRDSAAAMAKLAAARQVLNRRQRLIWTDDAEVPASGALYDELTASGQALLIAPSPRQGLQPKDMDAIEAFIRQQ